MRATSSSASPYEGLTTMDASTPERVSRDFTDLLNTAGDEA